MTDEQIHEMTDDQLRVAIAEALGWKVASIKAINGERLTFSKPSGHHGSINHHCPDWPRDLNAVYRDLIEPLYKRGYSFLVRSNPPESGFSIPGGCHDAVISPERGNADYPDCNYSFSWNHDDPATAACGVWLAVMRGLDRPNRKPVSDMQADAIKAEVEERGGRYDFTWLMDEVGSFDCITSRPGYYSYSKTIRGKRYPVTFSGKGKGYTESMARIWLKEQKYNESR